MTKILGNMKEKAGRIVLFVVAFSVVPMLAEYYFVQSTNADYWFNYQKILVAEAVDFADPTIDVVSFAVVKRPVLLNWNDTLWCSTGDGFEFVGSNTSEKYYTEATILPRVDINSETGAERFIPWRFDVTGELLPKETCYIESTITAKLRFGIERVSVVRSNEFVVK